jgi:hypothetical protein
MWTRRVVGIALCLIGIVWIGQGVGTVKGSFMTGQAGWAVTGAVALVLGIGLLISASRATARRRRGDGEPETTSYPY